jgi:Ran-binding protein 1
MSEPASNPAEPAKESSPTPVFGSASTFGGGSGFGGFSGVAAGQSSGFGGSTAQGEAPREEGEEDGGGGDEEECSAEFKPVVQLDEVEVQTGEEGEEVMADFKCKLYRYDQGSGEWKERGVGPMKLLRHKDNDRIRLLMRQDKTLKIRANHIVMPGTRMQEHSGNEKSIVWSAVDFADEEQRTEMFCARFASQDRAQEFMREHEKAMEHNDKVLEQQEGGGEGEGEGAEAGDAGESAGEAAGEAAAAGEGGTADAEEAPAQKSDADALADQVGTVRVDDEKAPAATDKQPGAEEPKTA